MQSLKEQFIAQVVREAVANTPAGHKTRIMDLGCGTASYVPLLLREFPEIEYVGVEPIESSFAVAQKNLDGLDNAIVHFKLGYDSVPDEKEQSFDLVFSLSVLEHIKQLQRFISLSAKYIKTGGLVVHRYDLGHALHTHSIKEGIHVWLGNTVPSILPERQFVRYVPEIEVRACYVKAGLIPVKTTYHQMPNHKRLEKNLKQSNGEAVRELFAWEMKWQAEFLKIPLKEREYLFPAVAVWGKKE